jgi:hypothetical protein
MGFAWYQDDDDIGFDLPGHRRLSQARRGRRREPRGSGRANPLAAAGRHGQRRPMLERLLSRPDDAALMPGAHALTRRPPRHSA